MSATKFAAVGSPPMLMRNPQAPGSSHDGLGDFAEFMGVREFPRFAFSTSAVRKAGERLAETISLDDSTSSADREEILETFAVANSWRDSHVFPMRSVRYSVRHLMKKGSVTGGVVSRPKRMSSIRRKLRSGSIRLDQINDLGGCRAIMNDSAGVTALIESIRADFPHEIRREYPYISVPKDDGYRSHHIVLNFLGKGEREVFSGRRIELQIRTRLQHSWATAVEAVGLYRGEDLKHHAGSKDWLRLFALASAEFAEAEKCPIPSTMANRAARVAELRELEARLNAVDALENIKNATHYAENFQFDRGRYYLIRYRRDHTVVVENYDSPIVASKQLGDLEGLIETGQDDEKVVLVEVDKIDRLIETYPSYFGDVSLFVSNLRSVCQGKPAVEYSMAPQKVVAPKPHEKPDPSLLRRQYTRWTEKGR